MMTQFRQFDPYYIWLGISPNEQPANLYRLLDVRPFESDLEIVDTGYNRRMAYLRSIKDGDYLELAEKLKDELTTARLCLTNTAKKVAYDAELRAHNQATAASSTFASPPPMPPPISYGIAVPVEAESPADDAEAIGDFPPAFFAVEWNRRFAVGVAAAVLAVGGILFSMLSRGETYVTRIDILEDDEPVVIDLVTPMPSPSPSPPRPSPTPGAAPTSTPSPKAPIVAIIPTPSATASTITRSLVPNLPPVAPVATPSGTNDSVAESLATGVPTGTVISKPSPIPVIVEPAAREFELEFDAARHPNIAVTAPTLTYDGRTPLTIEFWCRPTDKGIDRALDCLICGFGVTVNRNDRRPYLAFHLTKTDTEAHAWLKHIEYMGSGFSPGDASQLSVFPAVRLDAPHHLALVATPTIGTRLDLHVYIDGKRGAGTTTTMPEIRSSFVLSGAGFTGRIDELRISRTARYASDFTPSPRFEPDVDTVALYHFDEGGGGQLIDSGSGRHHIRTVPAMMRWIPLPSGAPVESPAQATPQPTLDPRRVLRLQ